MNHRTMIALLACPALWASVPPSTGQGGGTLDANYQVYVGDSTKPAVVVGSALPKWGQQDGARWIGPASGGRIDGNVIYQLTFTVVDLSKAKLTMSVLADPDVDINVNGTFLPQLHSYTTPDVVVLDASRGLQAGTNMIHFWVSDNGTTANLNVSFTGTLGDAASPPPKPKNTGVARYSALSLDEPVESASGQYFDTAKDLQLGGPLKFGFSRYYSSALSSSGATSALGTNWMSNFDTKITVAGTTASVLLFGGKVLTFENTGGGWRLQSPLDTIYQLATVSTGYQLLDPNTRWIYSYSSTGALTAIKDRNANSIVVTQGANGPISAADGAGRTLNFTYAGAQLVKVADQVGRTYTFAYSGGLLQSAADDASHATTYAYTPSGALLVSQQLPLGNKPATQAYDSSGRVISQTDGRGNVTRLSYDGNGTTTITDPTGNIFRQTSDTNGVVIQEID
ncbi:MAG: DUF6531 domain-containing protein, partial [Acidobacteriia bacterium]|nr:DUF6531 domain-containing protein [Terriglobia bacterium]